MRRSLFLVLLAGLLAAPLCAQDAPKKEDNPIAAALEKLKASPDDATALQKYVNGAMNEVIRLGNTKPEEAEKKLAEVLKALDELKPTEEKGQANLKNIQTAVKNYGEQLALQKMTLAEVEKLLDASPDDAATISKYIRKVMTDASSKSRTDPAAAIETIAAGKARLAKLAETTKDETVKKQIEASNRQFAGLDQQIAAAKKLLDLVGKDAKALEVETWVNGTPLKDADLKGKVVLLDFWAVWCGPCIATFPHLIEWNEQYSNKGLVIIGLTNYYNYKWDEAAGRANRDTEKVSPEDEQAMLVKFAEHHKLHHRFGVQPKGSTMSEYYGVTGIPHVVLIDQEGKIRLIRVGSGDANAKDISDMLTKLLGAPAPASAGEKPGDKPAEKPVKTEAAAK